MREGAKILTVRDSNSSQINCTGFVGQASSGFYYLRYSWIVIAKNYCPECGFNHGVVGAALDDTNNILKNVRAMSPVPELARYSALNSDGRIEQIW